MNSKLKLYIFFCSVFCTIVITGNLIFQKFVKINILSLEFELSVGVLFYPVTFLISDLVTEFYGTQNAKYIIKISVLCSLIVMGLVMVSDHLPAALWSNIDNENFHKMFSVYGVASIGSIVATFLAGLVDVQIFSYLKYLTKSKYLWLRNSLSTLIGQVMDTTLVLTIICYARILAWENYHAIVVSSIIFKIIVSVISIPFCYLGYYLINKFVMKVSKSEKNEDTAA